MNARSRTPTRKRPPSAVGGNGLPSARLGRVEQIPLDLLRPYDRNARTHDQRQVAKIAASLETFGWMNPILAESDGTIIAGHGRWTAARELKMDTVPVIRVEHLTPDQVRAYRLADNRLAELAGWDEEMLTIELQHLSTIDLDCSIEVIGWDHAEIDVMLDQPEATEGKLDPADEDVPPVQMQAVSRTGDIWLLGPHRLLCGSALDAVSFQRLMAGATATMVFADAPYNVPVDGHVSGLGKTKHREFAMASGEMSEEQFTGFLATNLALVTTNACDGAVFALCMDWRGMLPLQIAMGREGLDLINLAVWVKTNGGMGSLYRSQHELVLIGKKGSAPHINNVQLGRHKRYRTNVWRYAGVNSFGRDRLAMLASHPTVKPIALVADAIRDVSNRGDIVLDSFMGSGTTLLAAERTNRIAYGMDIDPHYVDLAVRRWQTMTRKNASLEGDTCSFDEVAERRAVEITR